MARAKYKDYYNQMMESHKELFTQFKEIHDHYVSDSDKYREEFNTVGAKVVEILRETELRLCQASEGGQYGKYAVQLADKFWNEVRKTYPKIDFVGTH